MATARACLEHRRRHRTPWGLRCVAVQKQKNVNPAPDAPPSASPFVMAVDRLSASISRVVDPGPLRSFAKTAVISLLSTSKTKPRGAFGALSPSSDASPHEHVYVRSAAVFWSCAGVFFVWWQLSHESDPHVGSLLAVVVTGLLLFAAPSAVVLGVTARRHRASASKEAGPPNVRVDVGDPEIRESGSGDAEPSRGPLDAEAGEEPGRRQQSR